jgi:putative Mg2+ transporter-C (MgtC) family protein
MLADTLNLSMPLWDAALRLGAALFFAGIIGWEREIKGRSAGLRTHMLVSLGAAGFALLGMELIAGTSPGPSGADKGDPIRIIGAIAAGIGFLGAGAILQSGGKVQGLTTAASIWVVSAMGVACGTGYWAIAILLTAMGLMTLTLLRWLEPAAQGNHASESTEDDKFGNEGHPPSVEAAPPND